MSVLPFPMSFIPLWVDLLRFFRRNSVLRIRKDCHRKGLFFMTVFNRVLFTGFFGILLISYEEDFVKNGKSIRKD